MNAGRVVATLLTAVASIVMVPSPPDASAIGGGHLGGTPPELGVGLLVSLPGAPAGHDPLDARDRAVPSPVWFKLVASHGGGIVDLCYVNARAPAIWDGWWFTVEAYVTSTNQYLGVVGRRCVLQNPAGSGAAPPAPTAPRAPTIGEIWRAVGLPAPELGVSPAGHGITGLPTWVWTRGAGAVGVAVALRGFTISGTARIVGYAAYPGEGGWARSDAAGAPDSPAVAHTYETTGTYRLGVATLWSARAVMHAPGLARSITIDLGTALVTNARDYPVTQVRSRLVP